MPSHPIVEFLGGFLISPEALRANAHKSFEQLSGQPVRPGGGGQG